MTLKKYMLENFKEVVHTTLNPEGPGVVRIHLIPPKVEKGKPASSVAIINGQDIIPVNYAWSVLLAEFIKEVNKYHGREVSDADVENILDNTCKFLLRALDNVQIRLGYRMLCHKYGTPVLIRLYRSLISIDLLSYIYNILLIKSYNRSVYRQSTYRICSHQTLRSLACHLTD